MATKKTKKNGRGGARAGAGRPPTGQPLMVSHTVTLPADLAQRLADLGKSDQGKPNLSAGIRLLAERAGL
jgi:hypothetical protein